MQKFEPALVISRERLERKTNEKEKASNTRRKQIRQKTGMKILVF